MARLRRKRSKASKPKNVKPVDRLSKLPDELIHKIHSSLDIVYAVQASRFSRRWKNIWKSLTHVHFDRRYFRRTIDFSNYVSEFLDHRDHQADLSVVTLRSAQGAIGLPLLMKVAQHASAGRVKRLDVSSAVSRERPGKCGGVSPLPLSVFHCDSMHELQLKSKNLRLSNLPQPSWNLPALTTLLLKDVSFEFCCVNHSTNSVDLFSNMPNLKNLTLIECSTSRLLGFKIISPELQTLVIESRIVRHDCEFMLSAPKLLSFTYRGDDGIVLSTENLDCLKDIRIDLGGPSCMNAEDDERLIASYRVDRMIHQLNGAKFVSLTLYAIEVLCLTVQLVEPDEEEDAPPFTNLECLKIDGRRYHKTRLALMATFIDHLTRASENARTINESEEDFFVFFLSRNEFL